MRECRPLGAPIVLILFKTKLEWWKQESAAEPRRIKVVPGSAIERFFDDNRDKLAPEAVYRAKTWARFNSDYQLSFVDKGLMPLVEGETGKHLSGLVERCVSGLKAALWPKDLTSQQGNWMLQVVFRLLAAKILRDKQVRAFCELDLHNVEDVLARVGRHYGTASRVPVDTGRQRQAMEAVFEDIGRCSSLAHMSTESLAYVYENALISKETRRQLGTHSTPPYLVDYIVWQLAPWIEEISESDRHVFEPACGHAAFLVSASRLLRHLLPAGRSEQKQYLRDRLRGIEIDPFALEIARLSLTLADVPNPNGWDLQSADMFLARALEKGASAACVLLANPPFENFTKTEQAEYAKSGVQLRHINKTAEMLSRTLPHLKPGAVFGVVVPQGFLHSKNAADVREQIATNFEIREICLFPDKIFAFSDMESAIILGRKSEARGPVRYCRVREKDTSRFKERYEVTAETSVGQDRFSRESRWSMRVPDLLEVWECTSDYVRLGDVAEVGQGLIYHSAENRPSDQPTISKTRFPGAVKGFARFDSKLQTHELAPESWMNVEHSVIRRPVSGTRVGCPQILINYAPVSRGPWRLKALLDVEGHAVTSCFLTIRPKSDVYSLEFLWGLCNSPLVNAYIYAHGLKRHVLAGVLRAMPVPSVSATDVETVNRAVSNYIRAVARHPSQRASTPSDETMHNLLLEVDAAVLRLYDLPPRLERQLLDVFAGRERPGVPCTFKRYFPEGFEPYFPLHEYISDEYKRSTAGELYKRHQNITSPELLAAIKRAVEDFKE